MLTSALAAILPAVGTVPALGPSFLNPDQFIASFGSYAIVGIAIAVFVETGLLFPFLPGDSLLFAAGALVAGGSEQLNFPLWALCLLLFAAAFAGDQTAYLIGRRGGRRLLDRPDSRFFKRKYIEQTDDYFKRYGGRTIVIARFVPFVRTYAAVVAGVARMPYRTFVSFNAVGGLSWVVGVTLLGYALGNVPFVKANIELLLVLVVVLSLVPIAVEALRGRSRARSARAGARAEPDVAVGAEQADTLES